MSYSVRSDNFTDIKETSPARSDFMSDVSNSSQLTKQVKTKETLFLQKLLQTKRHCQHLTGLSGHFL